MTRILGSLLFLTALPPVAGAQPQAGEPDRSTASVDADADQERRTIIVRGQRIRGAVGYPVEPLRVIGADRAGDYGAATVGELVQALEPETRLSGGSSSDAPIILLSGSRIGSLSEISGLPSEAIERVEILPEELAAAYGYPPTRRVLNIVLRQRFESASSQAEGSVATAGGRESIAGEAGLVRIRGGARTNLDLSLSDADPLTRFERGLADNPADAAGLLTLIPASRQLSANLAIALPTLQQVAMTLNFGARRAEGFSRIGLGDGATPGPPAALAEADRRVRADSYRVGFNASGDRGSWRWSALTAFERGDEEVGDRDLAQPGQSSFGSAFLSRLASESLRGELQASGPLTPLPAGEAFAAVTLGGLYETISAALPAQGLLAERARRSLTIDVNLHLPISDGQAARGIGALAVITGFALRHFSDFGLLTTLRLNGRWTPIAPLTLVAGFTRDEGAPTIRQLGEPILATPNVPIVDFANGGEADVTIITGGNPALSRNLRTEQKIELLVRPLPGEDLLLSASYTQARLTDPISLFPALTADVEAAFPSRVARQGGRLVRIDTRPITVAESRFRGARWGASYAGSLGSSEQAGRFALSAYHSIRFENRVTLTRGGPVLDLLEGAALGSQSGLPRHSVELQGHLFRAPWGLQLDARWQSGSEIRTLPAVRSESDLVFAPYATINARGFVNLEGLLPQGRLRPLRNTRLSLAIDNLLDEGPAARDRRGVVPFGYQRRFLDAIGRAVRVSLRILL